MVKTKQRLLSLFLSLCMVCMFIPQIATANVSAQAATGLTATQIVDNMGLGWNLGNTFDCWGFSHNTDTADSETAWGNSKTTQEMITAVHDSGFDSIRIPVSWAYYTDATTFDINDAYLARIKEVIDYAYNNDMYVIINMHWDWVSNGTQWLNAGMDALPQFTAMWTEIANYFKDYDQHLVFEDMNEVTFDYTTLNTFNQRFVTTVRETGGNNTTRLLLLAGANDDLSSTCSPEYVVPNDSMVAVSVHYYYPPEWAVATTDSTWGYASTWGTDAEKQDVYDNFAKLKAYFVDEGVPVIVGEYGVLTGEDQEKDHDCIIDYLSTIASSALATDGVAAFLWDAGNAGDMQYFDRNNLTWFSSDYANVYSELKKYGTNIEFAYDITKSTATSDRTTVTLSGDPDYTIDLTPYAGKGVTINQVILNGTAGGGWGVSFTATNPDGTNRNWTSESGEVGSDGSVTIAIDGIFNEDNGAESYILTMGSMSFARWWGTEGATLDSVTLVFDKEITYTTVDATATAKYKSARLSGYSLSLDGDIGVNFYMALDEDILSSETAYMQFTIAKSDETTETQKVLVKDVLGNTETVNDKTYYKFKCRVSAKDMTANITAQMIDGTNTGTEYTYTVKDYAKAILDAPDKYFDEAKRESGVNLVKAMINYGSYAQIYFYPYINSVDDDGIACKDLNTGAEQVPAIADLEGKYSEPDVLLPEGVSFEGATLSLKSETTLSLYFKNPNNVQFDVSHNWSNYGNRYIIKEKSGEYTIVRIRGISAKDLKNDLDILINDDYHIIYNPLYYCQKVLESDSTSEGLKNVCRALFLYWNAANGYSE